MVAVAGHPWGKGSQENNLISRQKVTFSSLSEMKMPDITLQNMYYFILILSIVNSMNYMSYICFRVDYFQCFTVTAVQHFEMPYPSCNRKILANLHQNRDALSTMWIIISFMSDSLIC